MSASKPIEYSDLVREGTFEKFAADADMLIVHFKNLENGIREAVKPLGEKIKSNIVNAKDLKEQSEAIDKISAAEKAQINVLNEKARIQKELIDYKDQLKKANKAEADEIKKANALSKEQLQLSKLKEKAIKSEAGSYNELSAKLAIVSIRAKQMSAAHRENTATGKMVIAQQLELRNKLIALDETTNLHVRKVGNYTGAITKLGKGIGGLTGLMGTLGSILGFDTERMQQLTEVGHELIKMTRELHHTTELAEVSEKLHGEAIETTTAAEETNTLATEEHATATQADTIVTEENIAAKEELAVVNGEVTASAQVATVAEEEMDAAFAISPIGILIASLIALGAALYGLNAYMTRDTEAVKEATEAYELQRQATEALTFSISEMIKVEEARLKLMEAQGASEAKLKEQRTGIFIQQSIMIKSHLTETKALIKKNEATINQIEANDSLGEALLRLQAYAPTTTDSQREEILASIKLKKTQRETEAINSLSKARRELIDLSVQQQVLDYDYNTQETKIDKKNKDDAAKEADDAKKKHDREVKEASKKKTQAQLDAEDLEKYYAEKKRIEDNMYQDEKNQAAKLAKQKEDIAKAEKEADDEEIAAWLEAEKKKDEEIDKQIVARKKALQDELDFTNRMISAIGKGLDGRTKAQEDALKTQTSLIDSELQIQTQLFAAGLDNTLEYEKRARAEATEEELKEQRKAAKEKKGIELAQTYIAFVQSYLKSGENSKSAATKALADTLVVEGIEDAIAGKFKDGVENFRGKGTGTSDSNIIGFSNGESVVTEDGTKQTNGLVTAINKDGYDGVVDWAMKNIYAPNFASSLVSDEIKGNSNADYNLMLSLNSTIETSIAKGFSKIKQTNWSEDALNRLVKTELSNGLQKTTIHHGRIC